MDCNNLLTLHLNLCRLVVENSAEGSSWGDLYKILPQLRQALACTVCGELVDNPQSHDSGLCSHCVCLACKGERKRLKPSCSYCKDYEAYSPNQQRQLVVSAFRKTCQYLQLTDIYRKLKQFSQSCGISSLVELICEGAGETQHGLREADNTLIKIEPHDQAVSYHANINIASPFPTLESSTINRVESEDSFIEAHGYAASVDTALESSKVSISNDRILGSPVLHEIPVTQPSSVLLNQVPSSFPQQQNMMENTPYSVSPPVTFNHIRFKKIPNGVKDSHSVNKRKALKGSGCRCGNATPTPGKLTCCGQRCPCYIESKACIDCRCRGCRNPHRPGGKKVLPYIANPSGVTVHELQSPPAHQLTGVSYNLPSSPFVRDHQHLPIHFNHLGHQVQPLHSVVSPFIHHTHMVQPLMQAQQSTTHAAVVQLLSPAPLNSFNSSMYLSSQVPSTDVMKV